VVAVLEVSAALGVAGVFASAAVSWALLVLGVFGVFWVLGVLGVLEVVPAAATVGVGSVVDLTGGAAAGALCEAPASALGAVAWGPVAADCGPVVGSAAFGAAGCFAGSLAAVLSEAAVGDCFGIGVGVGIGVGFG
jgi:hypothetical protein